MFESDDYDQVLSQLDFPNETAGVTTLATPSTSQKKCVENETNKTLSNNILNESITPSKLQNSCFRDQNERENVTVVNPRKRTLLNSHFNHAGKRKFPGPAGLLTGSLEKTADKSICQMELLSQDVDFTPNHLFSDVLESPLWKRLLEDTRTLSGINTISSIKETSISSNIHSKKANIVIAVVEAIDRFGADPLITLRDTTGQIKSTLHRDAWKSFSVYFVSQYCALVLYKPTVLTTGGSSKRHYLNITLRNISSIYSSAVLKDNELPDGFTMSCEDGFTVIKANETGSVEKESRNKENDEDLLEDLDDVFADEMF